MDTVACCLFMNGHIIDAVKMSKECVKIDPENKLWMERIAEFRAGLKK